MDKAHPCHFPLTSKAVKPPTGQGWSQAGVQTVKWVALEGRPEV